MKMAGVEKEADGTTEVKDMTGIKGMKNDVRKKRSVSLTLPRTRAVSLFM
jgi:hypothetical protein